MRHFRGLSVLLACFAAGGLGSTSPAGGSEPLIDQGALLVYLKPFDRATARLELQFAEIAANREDANAQSLEIDLNPLLGSEQIRQRRLASGRLPVDSYSGLTLRIRRARRQTADGPVELLVPEESIEIQVPFRIEKRRAVVLHLEISSSGSGATGHSFSPTLAAYPAPRPAAGLLGLASIPDANLVVFFDKRSGEVIGAISTGREPRGLALDLRRPIAYVALAGEDRILSIDLLEVRVLTELGLRAGDEPRGLALTPDGRTLLSANYGTRTLSLVDALSMVETDRILVGDQPEAVLIEPAGRRAYVFNAGAASITVIDIRTRLIVGTTATEPGPFWGQLDRAAESLYVAHRSAPFVSIIDTRTLTVRSRIMVGTGTSALKVHPQNDLIYLARRGSHEIEIYDPLSLLPIDAITLAVPVSYLTVDREQNLIFALLPELREIQATESMRPQIRTRVDIGEAPFWLVLNGE